MRAIVWVDVETTGVIPESDVLLEVAAAATDMKGNPISDLVEFLLPPASISEVRSLSDERVLEMHEESGLWRDLWLADQVTLTEVDDSLTAWIDGLNLTPQNTFFGGNSITLDREFTEYYLPRFYSRFSHRSVDVTSIALMLQGNFSFEQFSKRLEHRAGADVLESIEEYRFYIERLSAESG